jgi:hypothetical protein
MDPGDYLAWVERLGNVIVGAQFESPNPIIFGGSRREHHDRQR